MQFQGIIFIRLQGNDIIVVIIFIQGNYIHARKLHSFNNVEFPDIEDIFIQQVSLATLIMIISFIITIC